MPRAIVVVFPGRKDLPRAPRRRQRAAKPSTDNAPLLQRLDQILDKRPDSAPIVRKLLERLAHDLGVDEHEPAKGGA